MRSLGIRFVQDDRGQDLIEYGLLIGIITLAAMVAAQGIASKTAGYFTDLNDELP